jgi:MerR family transcriptional regulator, thiopeptide resistance regulator
VAVSAPASLTYSIGRIAALAGVTVRTLHHYDGIGLLTPTGRSAAGYREYDEEDPERLQQVLFYRELGCPLEEIVRLLNVPGTDVMEQLRRQRRLLTERYGRLRRMIVAIDKTLEAKRMNVHLTPEERFEVFGDFGPDQRAKEADTSWGDTEAYAQAQRRTATYTKQDWARSRAEAAAVEQQFAAAMHGGVCPQDAEAMDLAEAHRDHITRWFYDRTYDTHRGLGRTYVSDPRFTAHYERVAPGLAHYVHKAIEANATRR